MIRRVFALGLLSLVVSATGCARFIEILVEDKGYDAGIRYSNAPKLSGWVTEPAIYFASRDTHIVPEPTAEPVPPLEREQAAKMDAVEDEAALGDVYFDYDSWRLDDAATDLLQRHADWLREHPSRHLVIEGHCDQRGTLAYNLVLGEKRAKAARTYLVNLDIPANRLTAVSYGKERPFCDQADERCYRENRRGHFVVRTLTSRVE